MDDSPVYHTGILRTWTPRGFGFIEGVSHTLPTMRYFLHVREIQYGPTNPPIPGSFVLFEVGPPHKEGQLPTALRAWIIDPSEISPRKTEAV